MRDGKPVAELLAALAYGERLGAARARDNARFAPDERRRLEQEAVADREDRNYRLMEARLHEVGTAELTGRFAPFFDAFFAATEPTGWVEAQAWHYVGDALVSDFADVLVELVDPVSAEVVRRSLGSREEQEAFALDELTRAMEADPAEHENMAVYARRIAGEALTHTQRALSRTRLLRELLGGEEGEKRLVIDLLERHRVRMDRLGIEPVEADLGE
jgi:tRNA-(MS[2]IO[6]A)-hydroxylase (MiaE)-like